MRLGKRALAAEAGRHRLRRAARRARAARPRPRPNARPARHRSPAASPRPASRAASRDRCRIGAVRGSARPARSRADPAVPRSTDRRAPRPAPDRRGRCAGGEGAAHHVGDFARQDDRLGGLGDAAHLSDGVVVRRARGRCGADSPAASPGSAPIRRRPARRRRRRSPCPGPCCMQNTPDLAARGHARHGVGHVQADALLAHDDRPDVDGAPRTR